MAAIQEDIRDYSILGIVLLTFLITEITIYFLSGGTVFVLSHFFYFPVILLSFYMPRRGILLSTGFALFYVAIIYAFTPASTNDLISATMQFYVFVSVGIVISYLSNTLRASEKRYRQLAELLPEPIFETDTEGMISFTNRAGLRRFGYDVEDLARGFHMSSAIVSGEHERLNAALWDCLHGTPAASYEFTAQNRTGEQFPVIVYPGRIEEEGTVKGIRGIAIDVSDQKRTEQELRNRNRQLSVINEVIKATTSSRSVDESLETALGRILSLMRFDSGAIYLIDEQGTTAQLKTVKGSGADVQDAFLRTMKTIDLSNPDYRRLFTAEQPHFIECGGEMTTGEAGGMASVMGSVSFAALPLVAEERTLGAVFLSSRRSHRFTGEEKRLLEAIGRELGGAILCNILQDRLRVSIEEANLYLDIMTHDLNNAATATQGYAEILRDGSDPHIRQTAEKLLVSVRQSIEIIGTVATIRRIHERGRSLKPIRLKEVIENQITLFSDVRISYEVDGAVVLGDDLISEVFTNLIGNSLKFGGEEIEVTITVEESGLDYIISVEDNGPGIPEETKKRLFSRFQPGSSAMSGKGLGLSICRMLVEHYGGRIWAEDRISGSQESGTAIRFTLKKAVIPSHPDGSQRAAP